MSVNYLALPLLVVADRGSGLVNDDIIPPFPKGDALLARIGAGILVFGTAKAGSCCKIKRDSACALNKGSSAAYCVPDPTEVCMLLSF